MVGVFLRRLRFFMADEMACNPSSANKFVCQNKQVKKFSCKTLQVKKCAHKHYGAFNKT